VKVEKSIIGHLQWIIPMVRVIAGAFKSRLLKTLEGKLTRPTSDRLKETLFNLLQTQLKGRRFLDCFAGSGSIGIEALSRGASYAAFIESSPRASKVIRENLERLGLVLSRDYILLNQAVENGLKILQQAGSKFDIVFLDPPYAAAEQYPKVLEKLQHYKILNDEAVVIAEHSKHLTLVSEAAGLTRVRELKQGDSVLSVYSISKLSPEE
jgi:16S rRNA (guanine(966)-N(2))-methyltransferase RsmD